ncbi:MAG: metal ABC transporter substrate-binding protein [Chthoniobacteraceae bacterium]
MKTSFITLLAAMSVTARLFADAPVQVVSFSTITTEIAQKVGGDRVKVTGVVKPGIDPHDYEPKPDDLKQVGSAALILASGKHMENYTAKLQESAAPNAVLLQVGDAFPSLKMKEEGEAEKTIEDPHWWHSVANMKKAVRVVQDALTKISPGDKESFAKNADAYEAKLDELNKWVGAKIAELPRDRRKLVTSHDAFQYFARDYGFTIYPVQGVSTQDAISSTGVAALVQTIKDQHVKAVFFENIENPKVLTEITAETGAKIGGELYADGLGEGSEGTYEGMMHHNVTTIVEALK